MRHRVLITAPYFQPVAGRFAERFARAGIEPMLPTVRERLSEAELLPLVEDIDGALCGDDAYTERVLAHAPRLRVIAKWGTGIDSIDLEACRRRGIVVCNTPDAFTEPVADTTMGYILTLVRQLHLLSHDLKQGRWHKRPAPSLRECTVGLIGVGHIGRSVALRLMPFGARVLGCDPVRPPEAFLARCPIQLVELEPLLQASDVVSIHCNLNPTSRHLLNAQTLAILKPGAVVINTARGPIIDEPALVRALDEARVAGAALDVFEEEPLSASSPLRGMPQVLLAAHAANSSPLAWERVHDNTLRQLIAHLRAAPRLTAADAVSP